MLTYSTTHLPQLVLLKIVLQKEIKIKNKNLPIAEHLTERFLTVHGKRNIAGGKEKFPSENK